MFAVVEWGGLKPYTSEKGKKAYEIGDPEMSPIPCGQIAGLIDTIQPVQEIIDSMVAEADELRGRLNRMAS